MVTIKAISPDKALSILDEASGLPLSTVQEQIIRGTWTGLTYGAIAQQIGYDADYLKYVGSQLWRELSAALGRPVSKTNLRAVIQQIQRQKTAQLSHSTAAISASQIPCDWADAPAISPVYGRQHDLDQLWQWCEAARCRLVVLQGQGGIGKTTLVRYFAEQVAQCVKSHSFDRVVWRSLRAAPSPAELWQDLVTSLDATVIGDLTASQPTSPGQWLARLINRLQQQRCLVVLDNGESLLQGQSPLGEYLDGYAAYQAGFEQISTTSHQSCVVFTSRELPVGLETLRVNDPAVQVYAVPSLETSACQSLLAATGLVCEAPESAQLSDRYGGNPLALKLVGTTIQDLFAGQVQLFLDSGTPLLQGVRQVLAQQWQRLLPLEQQVMDWLAIYREPVSLQELQASFVHQPDLAELIEALESLWRRSLIEQSEATENQSPRFTQQPVIMEYVTRNLIERVTTALMGSDEPGRAIAAGAMVLNRYSLLIPSGLDYVCNTQRRLILQPILAQLLQRCGSRPAVEQHLRHWLKRCRTELSDAPGYGAGNGVNLLTTLANPLVQLDCAGLTLWRVDLRGAVMQQSNFVGADWRQSRFTETFGSVLCVACDAQSEWLASGDTNCEVRLWHRATGQLHHTLTGHSSWVRSLTFHPTQPHLISASNDHTLKVWDIATGRCLHTLAGHQHWVRDAVFAPVSSAYPVLASSDAAGQICLWDSETYAYIGAFKAHDQAVRSLAFGPDGDLFSGSEDGTLKRWRLGTQSCVQTFVGHQAAVYCVRVTDDGKRLISGSADGDIRVWEIATGQGLQTLAGHRDAVWSLSLSTDGQRLASGSADGTIRLWSLATGAGDGATPLLKEERTLLGHHHWVLAVQFLPKSSSTSAQPVLISGGDDQTVRLWDSSTGKPLRIFQGYTNGIYALTVDAQTGTLISGSQNGQIHHWQPKTGACLSSAQAHTAQIWCVAVSPDGRWLASGGMEPTVRLWHRPSDEARAGLDTETYWVRSIAFSPDSQILAISGTANEIQLWDVATGERRRSLIGHTAMAWAALFSPDGEQLASCSNDSTVKLWDWRSGICQQTFYGHSGPVESIVWSPDGQWLASAGGDGVIRLWDIPTGEIITQLTGHTDQIGKLAMSADGQCLASSSNDHTVRLWNRQTGHCDRVLELPDHLADAIAFLPSPQAHLLAIGDRDGQITLWDYQTGECTTTWTIPRPYEGLDITGVTGLTLAQTASLQRLGAIGNS